MAEAHQAVAFSFSITHEGWDINYDREVLNLVWDSGIRSWKKRIGRLRVSFRCAGTILNDSSQFLNEQFIEQSHFSCKLQNSIRNGAYPAHLQSLWIIISIAFGLHFSGKKTPFDLANRILPWLPG